MEYDILSESLVLYALRDLSDGKYYSASCENNKSYLDKCTRFYRLEDAKIVQEKYLYFDEIRKIKVIDIGAVE
jgi:hypothetical protein